MNKGWKGIAGPAALSMAALILAAGCGAAPTKAGPGPVQAPVVPEVRPAAAEATDITRDPALIPGPIGRSVPERVVVELTTKEVDGFLDDGATYSYWTFDGAVPGPLIRVRVGDTVELRLENDPSSQYVHSIDLHAVNGPGGGAMATQVKPGEEKRFTFKALNPGLYVYHCATPHVPTHVANGMYGLVVVEPEAGLAPVDREFYVVQGEIYTEQGRDTKGHLDYDGGRLLDERPTFVVFNGRAAALTGDRAMKARVGERVRLFVGNAGPNLSSSFHVIGEVFDTVHAEGAAEASHDVGVTAIPAGGAAWVEFTVDAPGTYVLVDHALSRALDKGAMAQIVVEGEENPGVFDAGEAPGGGGA